MEMQEALSRFGAWLATSAANNALGVRVDAVRSIVIDPTYDDVVREAMAAALRKHQPHPPAGRAPDGVPESSGLLIWRPGATEDDEIEILLVHPTNAKWAASYSIPKGLIEADEDLKTAALRETKEEIGIDFSGYDLVDGGIVENVDAKTKRVRKRVHFLIVEAPRSLPEMIDKRKLQEREVDWAGFVPVSKVSGRPALGGKMAIVGKITPYQMPLLDTLAQHLAERRRKSGELAEPLTPNVAGFPGLNDHQRRALRKLARRQAQDGHMLFGAFKEPPPGRVVLLALVNGALHAWVFPEREDPLPIPAGADTVTPPTGAAIFDLSALTGIDTPRPAPRQPTAPPVFSSRAASARPPKAGEAPLGWHVAAGARLESLREETAKWLETLGFPGYVPVPVVVLEFQRVGPIHADWIKDVPVPTGTTGDPDRRTFRVSVKAQPSGKLDVTSSYEFSGRKVVRRKPTTVVSPADFTPEVFFPDEWLMSIAEQVTQHATNPIERLSVSPSVQVCGLGEGPWHTQQITAPEHGAGWILVNANGCEHEFGDLYRRQSAAEEEARRLNIEESEVDLTRPPRTEYLPASREGFTLVVPDDVWTEWRKVEYDTYDLDDADMDPRRHAFYGAFTSAEQTPRGWKFAVTPEVEDYLLAAPGPIDSPMEMLHDDLMSAMNEPDSEDTRADKHRLRSLITGLKGIRDALYVRAGRPIVARAGSRLAEKLTTEQGALATAARTAVATTPRYEGEPEESWKARVLQSAKYYARKAAFPMLGTSPTGIAAQKVLAGAGGAILGGKAGAGAAVALVDAVDRATADAEDDRRRIHAPGAAEWGSRAARAAGLAPEDKPPRIERLSIDPGSACPVAGGFATARGARRDEVPHSAGEDFFTTRVKLAAWREAAEQAKGVLAKHDVVLGESIGCGRYACAFEVAGRPDIIAKLTGDPSEAAAWTLAMDSYGDPNGPSWPAALARTYCVEAMPVRVPRKGYTRPRPHTAWELPPVRRQYADERRLYLVVQERLLPLGDKQKRAFNDEGRSIRQAAGVLPDPFRGRVPNPDRGLAMLHEYLDKHGLGHEPFDGIVDLLRDLDDTAGILFSDVHGGNFLRDEAGTIKLIDLGSSTVPSVDVPALRGERAETTFSEVERCPWVPGTDIQTYMLEEHEEIEQLLGVVVGALGSSSAELVQRWKQAALDIEQHFLSEERDIFPILQQQGFTTDDLEAEHAPIREQMAAFERSITAGANTGSRRDALLQHLAQRLKKHAHDEEVRFGWRAA